MIKLTLRQAMVSATLSIFLAVSGCANPEPSGSADVDGSPGPNEDQASSSSSTFTSTSTLVSATPTSSTSLAVEPMECEALAYELRLETEVGRQFAETLPDGGIVLDPICHDFSGDGRRDVAFAMPGGGSGGAFAWAAFTGTGDAATPHDFRPVDAITGPESLAYLGGIRLERDGNLLVIDSAGARGRVRLLFEMVHIGASVNLDWVRSETY